MCSIGRRYFRQLCFNTGTDPCVIVLTMRQTLEDFARDLSTRLAGAGELLRNVVVLVRRKSSSAPMHNFAGQVCIVTGANAGIGLATSEALVERGAQVIVACRDKSRAEAAAKRLSRVKPLQGCQTYPVEVGSLDLASLDSVKAFAAKFSARRLPLALLICNAGVMAPPRRIEKKDGCEQQFQVNYLGHWLLTNQLLAGQQHLRKSHASANVNQQSQSPARNRQRQDYNSHQDVMAKHNQQPQQGLGAGETPGTRVVMLTSLTHSAGRIKFDDLHATKSYSGFHRYADSKLAILLGVREFATHMDRFPDRVDSIVAAHPGLLQTELAHKWLHNGCPRFLRPVGVPFIDFLFPKVFLPPEYAVQTILRAATDPDEQVHGGYVAHNQVVQPAKQAQDDAVARRLWDISCKLTHLTPASL